MRSFTRAILKRLARLHFEQRALAAHLEVFNAVRELKRYTLTEVLQTFNLTSHLREFEPNQLVLNESLSERLALQGVLESLLIAEPGEPRSTYRNDEPVEESQFSHEQSPVVPGDEAQDKQ